VEMLIETFLMYVVSTQHIHMSQPYVNIFTSFFIFHHTVDMTSEISCLLLLSISCHCFQYPCLTFVFKGWCGHYYFVGGFRFLLGLLVPLVSIYKSVRRHVLEDSSLNWLT